MSASPSEDPLIFPVGHYLGPFYPVGASTPSHHAVQVGADTVAVDDDNAFAIWALLHGLGSPLRTDTGELATDSPLAWTRSTVVSVAEELGLERPAATIADLLAQDVAVEVQQDTTDVVEFAQLYRIRPLLSGLGNSPDAPGVYGIGMPGSPPAVEVFRYEYELWQWGQANPTLWHACETLSAVWKELGSTDPVEADPVGRLNRYVGVTLHRLIGHGAAILDAAATPSL